VSVPASAASIADWSYQRGSDVAHG
jgi:hypothetical protein